MKKTLSLLALAVIPFFANANGFYVQTDVGASQIKIPALKEFNFNKSTMVQRLSLGQDSGQYDVALDYTNFGKVKSQYASIKFQSLGLSARYNFNVENDITPYLGVRLGYNQVKGHLHIDVGSEKYEEKRTEYKMGVGALGGVKYNFNKNIALNFNVEYNMLTTKSYQKTHQYGANVGLRYTF